jgi:uncharacterized membrane protein YgdD (TMEM256/DUF423 family)
MKAWRKFLIKYFMNKKFIATGALLGALAVALGAFGAHGLKKIVPEEIVQTFQTGVQYQMYHALALLFAGIIAEKFSSKLIQYTGWFFISGIILFSGSLYLLTIFKATETIGLTKIGLITPFGGLSFIAGWLCLFFSVLKK